MAGMLRSGSILSLCAMLVLTTGGCDESSNDVPTPEADAAADAEGGSGLEYGAACLRNRHCASQLCLVFPDREVSNCTITCDDDPDCAVVPGWSCGTHAGETVCLPPEPDAEPEPDAAADADACPETPTVAGGVTVYELIFPSSTYNRGNASAYYARVGPVDEVDPPDWSNDSCAAYVGQDRELDLDPQPSLDAGQLQVNGTLNPVTLLHDPFDQTYGSSLPAGHTNLFSAGSQIQLTAAGGADIDGHEFATTAPASVNLTTPRNSTTVSRAADLAFEWVSDGDGAMTVLLVAAVGDGEQLEAVTSIACAVTDAAGRVLIPAAALALLPAAADTAGFSVTRTVADSRTDCATALGLTVSTTFSGYLNLGP